VLEISFEELAENAENIAFGDDRLGVQFYMRTVEDKERTLAEGRRCFKDVEFVRIMIPGDRNPAVDRKVQMTGTLPTDDRLRFAKQYARFKQRTDNEQRHEGVPLSLWPQMPAALAEELKYINIFTVEQLAELADTYVSKVPMGQSWKQKAAEFIASQKDAMVVNKLQLELAERDNRIDTLEKAVADQTERLEALLRKSSK
jgi:hypothetical protein